VKPLKKIVIIGPESTGKSTLCAQLAKHYNTIWVKEYAREFLNIHEKYTYEDLLIIAKKQVEQEDETTKVLLDKAEISLSTKFLQDETKTITSTDRFLFIDTDLYVMQVWCEFVYNRCHNWILSQIASRKYDGYLLCNVDLPWEQDGMREYPDKETREKLYRFYKELMINQSTPWIEIEGNHQERMKMALGFVDEL
jgi:NadR type nicotinamide-nucleotide adenylyltransferase